MASLVSVNVGRSRSIATGRRSVRTAIWKAPVEGRVAARGVNLAGDEQADRSVHGGPDKAIYAYASEEIQAWEAELRHDLGPAPFGENLTTEGIDVSGALVGERWRIGTTLLEVVQPRLPCFKLALRIDEPAFLKRFARASRPGAYLRIVEEGEIGAEDEIRVGEKPEHGLTVGDVARIYHQERGRCALLLEAPELAEGWREWALRRTGDPVG